MLIRIFVPCAFGVIHKVIAKTNVTKFSLVHLSFKSQICVYTQVLSSL